MNTIIIHLRWTVNTIIVLHWTSQKTTVWSCSCFNGQWIGPIVEIYLKYLLCLWISRSNFVNASQEKFSPVSKVLHRIQNKFPDSQSATVCQIFVSASISSILSLKNKNRWSMLNTVKEKFDFCFALFCWLLGFWVEHFSFCQFWWRTRCRAFCRRSWNGFPLIYDQGLPRPRLPNSPLMPRRLKSFRQKLPPSSMCAKHWFTYCVYSLCNVFHLIYDGSSQNSL